MKFTTPLIVSTGYCTAHNFIKSMTREGGGVLDAHYLVNLGLNNIDSWFINSL